MLGPQPRFFSFSSDSIHMQGFTQEGGESHSVPEEGTTSGMCGSIDLDQNGFPLGATEFANHKISDQGFFHPEE